MQTLGELRYAFVLIPLFFVFMMYVVTANAQLLGINFLLAIVSASLLALITAEIPLTGNSEGTFIAFTMGFGLAFWGLSIAGFSGLSVLNWLTIPYKPSTNWSIAQDSSGQPYLVPPNTVINATSPTGLNVNSINFVSMIPDFGGWSGWTIWATIMIALSFMYCLGLYFLVSSRGQ